MKIALIGASGFVGSAILNEAVSRGHSVTAIVRDTSKLNPHPQVRAVAVDAQDPQAPRISMISTSRAPAPSSRQPTPPTAGCWWSAVPAAWR